MRTLQPNSKSCFVCGMGNRFGLRLRFYQTTEGEVIAETVLSEEYQGYPGVAHGGIVAAMLDEAAGRAWMSGGAPRFMYTARLEVRYRKHVPIGQPIRLVGRALESKRSLASATSALYDQEGRLLAEAQALLVDVPGEALKAVDLEQLGWKVYPED